MTLRQRAHKALTEYHLRHYKKFNKLMIDYVISKANTRTLEYIITYNILDKKNKK